MGKPAPTAALPPLDGGAPRTPQEPGRAVLVNFFASDCAPCAVEAPALAALQAQGARLVGVAYKDDDLSARRFLQTRGDPFAVVLADHSGRAAVDWGVSGVPETFAVGPDGRVLAKHSGALEPRDADRLLEAASRAQRGGAERSASTSG